uniref:E3 ubiquitin-protein ligase PPP1R11 n=1 Tax=Setaria digitata TaxID=48799 RepID=A0A915PQB2_9BILA
MSNECSVLKISSGISRIIVEEEKPDRKLHQAPLILRLKEPENEKPHVTWAEGTIDNENLGKLKSNCCCIWVEPRVWDDPTTWEQDECEVEHCRGHTLPTAP